MKEFLDKDLLTLGRYTISTIDLVVVVLVLIGIRVVLAIVDRLLKRYLSEDRGRYTSARQLSKYVIWVLGIAFMLESIGVRIGLILAGSAALLVGIGLGMQQIFSDLVSGIVLLMEGSATRGDVMEVDGMIGRVEEIRLRTSMIILRDGTSIIIPNHKFVSENVVNWSHGDPYRRFEVEVGVAYGTDTELVRKILMDCALEHPDVIQHPQRYPYVRFIDFGASALVFQLLFWSTNTFMIENTRSDLRFKIDKAFREHHVRIPFPQRDVHMIPPGTPGY
ncbi:MAG: mechanosensitive ion channel [Flavobacteriales bacterium]|nr:mechanosensitive ion channel [Flavobacteriales bacterium]